jgi:hypothetical protein
MKIRPDIQIKQDNLKIKSYFIGLKASLTFEELRNFVRRKILRKKDFVIPPPKK